MVIDHLSLVGASSIYGAFFTALTNDASNKNYDSLDVCTAQDEDFDLSLSSSIKET